MAKAAESKPLDLEEDVEPIKEEIKKPRSEPLGSSIGKPKKEEKKPSLEDFKERFDIYTRKDPLARTRWFSNRKRLNELSKDTPYGNDYTTNFAQAPDSPRYPDEDKGYKSETFVGGKKRVENSNTRKAEKEPLQSKIQHVDDEDAAASYYGDVAQPKVGTRLNDPNTPAGKFFRNQPKEVRQHQEHTTYDPDLSEKWKISQVHLMNTEDEAPPAEQDLTINADASQAAKSISQAKNKIAPLIPMIANIASSVMQSGGEQGAKGLRIKEPIVGVGVKTGKQYLMGEDGNETLIPDKKKKAGVDDNVGYFKDIGGNIEKKPKKKSHHSNCPYCNNPSEKNKQHDENPDKFHAWMESERQKTKSLGSSYKKWQSLPFKSTTPKQNKSIGEWITYAARQGYGTDESGDYYNTQNPAGDTSSRTSTHYISLKAKLFNTVFMNKIESADPSTVQHQPKVRKPHLDTGKPPFKTPRSEIDEVRASGTHNAMPKGQEKIPFKVLRGSKTKKPYLINAKDRDKIDPDLEKAIPKTAPIGTPTKETAPARDTIAPSTNPKNLPSMYKEPNVKTPDTGDSPNLTPKPSRGKLGFLKDKNPFKGRKQEPQKDGYMITDAGNLGMQVGGTNPNAARKVPHGVAAQDISKSFYSLRTKDGYGAGDLSLANVTPNTVVDDKETYIGQTASGKHRMVDRNKITNTRVGDDIHYYVNGVEDRGIVVKMGNEYIQVFKEDGHFHDVHINDTFFVKDIVVNKEWNRMDATERYDALTKIHAPSPRFIGKSWNELPVEIKELLTNKGAGSRIPPESGKVGGFSTELPPAPPKADDENTPYYDYKGVYYGTGKKGKLALQTRNDQTGFDYTKSEDFRKLKPTYQGDAEEKEKSDVEEGTYGNIGSTSNVAPSTSTNLDVSESTGYEDRPHISVEEVGSLPRRDAKDNNADETKEKEDDIKEPKESKDTRKVGVPTANYETFGITYSVKANAIWNKKTQRWEQKDV